MLRINKLENVSILCPQNKGDILLDTNEIFNDNILSFLDSLSKKLLANTKIKDYPDVAALAFWLRKSNLYKINQKFINKYKDKCLLSRGIVFHITPSNVDTIFMYSMAVSLMAGNSNVVRVSEKRSERVNFIISEINNLLQSSQFMELSNNILIVSYGHDDKITEYFSTLCDVRIIWGGNETVNRIRKIPCKTRCIDIPFADRYSFAVINADAIIKEQDLESVCNRFYNDCYTFDQNACSSPRLLIWLGDSDKVDEAKRKFWTVADRVINLKYNIQPANSVDKLTTAYSLAIKKEDVKLMPSIENGAARVEVEKLDDAVHELRCAAGFFIECRINNLEEITDFVRTEDQTMTTYGIDRETIMEFLIKNRPMGIDRVVELGHALDFNEIWDGFDLLRELTREVEIF